MGGVGGWSFTVFFVLTVVILAGGCGAGQVQWFSAGQRFKGMLSTLITLSSQGTVINNVKVNVKTQEINCFSAEGLS